MTIPVKCCAAAAALVVATQSFAATVFSDDFNGVASPQWGNEYGNWSAAAGVYDAENFSTFPNARTSLPYQLRDFTVEFDIGNVSDGGVWLRSTEAATGVGRTGVLLVTGGRTRTGTGVYWHIVNGPSYGAILNEKVGVFQNGASDPHLRVDVIGDTYSVYVNGSTTPTTTLTTNLFSIGQVALYDFSNQTFDNLVLSSYTISEPDSLALTLLLFGAIGLRSKRVRLVQCRTSPVA